MKSIHMRVFVVLALVILLLCSATACKKKAAPAAATEEPKALPTATEAPAAAPAADAAVDAASDAAPYALGDQVDDFTVTLSDGTQASLYGLLAEKKMVLINFWASYCGPCKMEFPFMEEAYNEVKDDVGILALSAHEPDTDEIVLQVKEEIGLTALPMGLAGDIANRFALAAYPTSVIIDRNGILCFQEAKSMPDKDKFLRLFEVFTADDYDKPVLLTKVPSEKPTMEMPAAEALEAALGADGKTIALSLDKDASVWPFLPAEDGVSAGNTAADDTEAILVATVNVNAGEALSFKYAASFPSIYSALTVSVDGAIVTAYPNVSQWTEDCVQFDHAEAHTVTFACVHGEYDLGEINAALKDFKIIPAAKAAAIIAARPAVPAKTLQGTECTVELIAGDAKQAKLMFKGDEDQPDYNYILSSDTLKLRIKLGSDVCDALAFMDDNGEYIMINSLPQDAEGYIYEYTKGSKEEAYLGRYSITVYGNALSQPGDSLATFTWFESEADLDAFTAFVVEMIKGYGMDTEVFWEYSDGSERQTPVSEAAIAAPQVPSGLSTYTIAVTDKQGHPVENAMLQICDADSCRVEYTGADGTVTMQMTPYAYEIHVLLVPDAYQRTDALYKMTEEGGSLVIELETK